MKTKYLLSTGGSTERVELYILDLFKLYLSIYPKDIPGSNMGFDFILTDTKKGDLKNEISNRIDSLVRTINNKFADNNNVTLTLDSIELLDAEKARLTVSVNETIETFTIEL